MSAINHQHEKTQSKWQQGFLEILPEIERRLRGAFRHLDPDSRDDSIENGIVHCLISYVRLFERGRADSVTPSNLAWYAVLQVKGGREAGCRMNLKEPLCRYAQLRKGFRAVPLHGCDPTGEGWINELVTGRRMSVADQVAIRLDIGAWLATLCRRTRSIAADLAKGFTTTEVAHKHGLTSGRIAQIRKELNRSWQEFQGEIGLASAG